MEGSQAWKAKLSFRNAAFLLCFLNLAAAIFLLHGFFFFGLSGRRPAARQDPALEEWRRRKMDRARQRELEKNGTLTAQPLHS